jgi:hypothetical protein
MLKSDGNIVLVASGNLESEGVEKLIEIVDDLLIEAVQLSSFARIRQKVRRRIFQRLIGYRSRLQ